MFWTLLTTMIAGVAGAGIGLVLRSISRNWLPKGIIPVAAGVTMITATAGTEYSWYPNVVRTMPEDLVILSERRQQAWYQPWTFIQPWVRGFVSYSPADTVETAENSGFYVVQIRLQERWQPQMILPNVIDCDANSRAVVMPETEFDETGRPSNAVWRDVDGDDPILSVLSVVCGRGTADN